MKIGGREFQTTGHTYVMGILNVTPDSFSDGGKWWRKEEKRSIDKALKHVEEMIADGMDLLDIGGESTRPGYTVLPADEEIERVAPMIEAVKANFDIPVSLDTYKAQVAEAGIRAGVDMINDIWGLKYDERLAGVIAGSGVVCCLLHNRRDMDYKNFMKDVAMDLAKSIRIAEKAGIADEKIILDPGVGFAKTYENNLEILNRLEELNMFGYPLLLGASRKSVIGRTLDLPVEDRMEGTLATTVLGVLKGCSFVRVHDVRENVRIIRMTEAIIHSGRSIDSRGNEPGAGMPI